MFKVQKRNPLSPNAVWTAAPDWNGGPVYNDGSFIHDLASHPPAPQPDGTLLWDAPWTQLRFTKS